MATPPREGVALRLRNQGDLCAVFDPTLSASHAVVPPSTGNATPVMNRASSEIRNSAALAISSGRAGRPIGFWPARWATSCSGSRPWVLCWSGRATRRLYSSAIDAQHRRVDGARADDVDPHAILGDALGRAP